MQSPRFLQSVHKLLAICPHRHQASLCAQQALQISHCVDSICHRRTHLPLMQDPLPAPDADSLQHTAAACDALYDRFVPPRLRVVRAGGNAKAVQRHTTTHGKLLVEDRLRHLLDDVSQSSDISHQSDSFLELGSVAGTDMPYGNVPRAGIITGIGKVAGRWCMVLANDATVKGGTIYPISLKKQLRAQEVAAQVGLPCIYLVDSGGAFLPLQADIFLQGGQVFYNEARMSANGVPQLAVVCGSCTAGGAYVPTMADEAVIVRGAGTIFLGGPPLVRAATGEVVTPEQLGGADLHCRTSGCTDYLADSEAEAYLTARGMVACLHLPAPPRPPAPYEEAAADPAGLQGFASTDYAQISMPQIIYRILDGSRFQEFKKFFGTDLITGFGTIHGFMVGVVANRNSASVSGESATKAAHFVQICSQRRLPLLFLQNTYGDGTDPLDPEEAKQHGQLMAAIACTEVPKIKIIVGGAAGPHSSLMCGRAFNPAFVFSWPTAYTSYCTREQLAKDGAGSDNDESSALFSASRLFCDGILRPADTRKVLGTCLQIIYSGSRYPPCAEPLLKM